mmetsp:Transcript_28815/g.48695  ORF Transcript_28815/g.48695 Transcript_28815/m.48695 type:complete len:167 (-) Transcript_28815:248-748(-)
MDRVILGPCRVIAVYLERKLTPSEKASLTYQSAFREFMSGGDDASRLMMSPARQQLLDEVQELDGVSLKQANAIASELCTNIQFHVPAPHRLRRLNARPPPGDQRGAAESVLRGGAALHLVPSRPRVSESLLLKAAEAAGSREEVRQQPERDQELQPAAPSSWWCR